MMHPPRFFVAKIQLSDDCDVRGGDNVQGGGVGEGQLGASRSQATSEGKQAL